MRTRGSNVIVTGALSAFLVGAGATSPLAAIASLAIAYGIESPVVAGVIGASGLVAVGAIDWLVLRPHLGARVSGRRWVCGLFVGCAAVLLTAILTLASVTALGPLLGGLAVGSFVGSVAVLFHDTLSAWKRRYDRALHGVVARAVALVALVLTQAGMLFWAYATGRSLDQLFFMGLPVSTGLALMLMAIIFPVLGSSVKDQDSTA